jgi:branched-chain amino acid aminotransferase
MITPPYSDDEMIDACKAVIKANGFEECYIRPIIFLGEAASPIAAPLRCAVIASEDGPLTKPPDGGIRARVSSFQRVSVNAIPPSAKAAGQYLNSFLAKMEALASGYDEAIFLNSAGFVTDGSSQNVFVVSDDTLVTPPTSSGSLAGITRSTLMTLASEIGIASEECNLIRTDLYNADECFLAGTASEIVPVVAVDDREVGSGDVGALTKTLQDAYRDCVFGRNPKYENWLDRV